MRQTTQGGEQLELDPPLPGLGPQIDEGMAVAIDGEIFEDACLTTLNPDLTLRFSNGF